MVDPSHSFEDLSGLRVITKAGPSQAARILMGLSSIGSVPSSHHSFQAELSTGNKRTNPYLGRYKSLAQLDVWGKLDVGKSDGYGTIDLWIPVPVPVCPCGSCSSPLASKFKTLVPLGFVVVILSLSPSCSTD